MDPVGVRELRQNLSVYLRRVQQGETLEVTERGVPVAVLAPRPAPGGWRDRMIADGRLIPGRTPWAELPEFVGPLGELGTAALFADREGKE